MVYTMAKLSEERQKSEKGRAAEKLLNNRTLTQALKDMEAGALDGIADSSPDQEELREDLYRMIKVIRSLKKLLKVYVNLGKNADVKIEEIMNGG